MPHKYTQTNSLTAIKSYCEKISPNLQKKTDLELVDIAQSETSQSQLAKSLIINRYLPKVLKDSKRIFNGQNSDPWHRDDIIQTGIKAIIVAINSFNKEKTNHEDLSGAVTKTIRKDALREIELPIPTKSKQDEFALFIEQHKKLLDDQKSLKENYEQSFNALMQKAFKGELNL